MSKNHPIRKLIESDAKEWFKNALADSPMADAFNNLVRIAKLTDKIKVKNTINDLKTMLEDVKTKYNMLQYINANTYDSNFKNDVFDYINKVDKSEE